jgi:hypothetical protein
MVVDGAAKAPLGKMTYAEAVKIAADRDEALVQVRGGRVESAHLSSPKRRRRRPQRSSDSLGRETTSVALCIWCDAMSLCVEYERGCMTDCGPSATLQQANVHQVPLHLLSSSQQTAGTQELLRGCADGSETVSIVARQSLYAVPHVL